MGGISFNISRLLVPVTRKWLPRRVTDLLPCLPAIRDMYEEPNQSRSSRKVAKDQKWLKTNLSDLLDPGGAHKLYNDLVEQNELDSIKKEDKDTTCAFPDFKSTVLRGKGVEKLHTRLQEGLRKSLQPLGHTPSVDLFSKQEAIWRRVIMATETFYSPDKLKQTLAKLTEEEEIVESEKKKTSEDTDKKRVGHRTADNVLIEAGVKTGLSLVFSLLRQVWAQSAWQRQLHQALTATGSLGTML